MNVLNEKVPFAKLRPLTLSEFKAKYYGTELKMFHTYMCLYVCASCLIAKCRFNKERYCCQKLIFTRLPNLGHAKPQVQSRGKVNRKDCRALGSSAAAITYYQVTRLLGYHLSHKKILPLSTVLECKFFPTLHTKSKLLL